MDEKQTKYRWISLRPIWPEKVFSWGGFVGWDNSDRTFCVGFFFYKWVLIVGPHAFGDDLA